MLRYLKLCYVFFISSRLIKIVHKKLINLTDSCYTHSRRPLLLLPPLLPQTTQMKFKQQQPPLQQKTTQFKYENSTKEVI